MKHAVVVLAEQALTDADARAIRDLHGVLGNDLAYYVLMPVENAALRLERSLGSLGIGATTDSAPLILDMTNVEELHSGHLAAAREALSTSIAALRATGVVASGRVVDTPPVDCLKDAVLTLDAVASTVITRPHRFADLLRISWPAQAARSLRGHVVHSLEHELLAVAH